MVEFEADLGQAYFLMFVGAAGMIIIGLYVLIKILLYIRRKKKESEKRVE
ncbi:MAG: hypothetical protein ACTSPS_08835 [Promethearchaeota archaeon]|jgi:hypothetical protein